MPVREKGLTAGPAAFIYRCSLSGRRVPRPDSQQHQRSRWRRQGFQPPNDAWRLSQIPGDLQKRASTVTISALEDVQAARFSLQAA